jgi:hypothetical protein
VHGLAPIVLQILADPDEVPQRLLFRGRDADGGELARPVEARQVAGIEAISLALGVTEEEDDDHDKNNGE